MVPTWIGKPGKHFPVRERSRHFEQTEKGILPKMVKVKIKTLKKYWKMEKKNPEKVGTFVSPKMWKPCLCLA